ncbi:MAG: amidohydrolase family protein [Pseudomonadota bacterium]
MSEARVAGPIVLAGGTIIDGLGAAPYQGSIVIEGERIAAVQTGAADAPAGATVVDVSGLTVMPGLIDAHCHITFDEPRSNDELFFHRREGLAALIAARNVQKLLRAGVTGFFDADSIYDTGVDLRDALEAGVTPGPRMSTGGNVLMTSVGGTAGRLLPDEGRRGYGRIVRNKDEIVFETRRQIKNGVDWIKVHVTGLVPRQTEAGEIQVWTYEELRLVVETAHDLGIPVVGHCRNASSTRDAARAGFDMILHATYMDDEALEAVVDAKTPIVPTLTFQANLADYGERIGASKEYREIFRREIEESAEMLRKAYDAGAPMLCGTESGFSITPYGDWHYRELEVFVRDFGLTPLQAIQCATSEGARSLKMDGKTGAVEAGRLADLIVVDGDPSEDVTVLGDKANIRQVYVGGAPQNLEPLSPMRADPPGWRVTPFSEDILTWDLVHGGDLVHSRSKRS